MKLFSKTSNDVIYEFDFYGGMTLNVAAAQIERAFKAFKESDSYTGNLLYDRGNVYDDFVDEETEFDNFRDEVAALIFYELKNN